MSAWLNTTGYDYDLSGNQTEDPAVPGTLVYDAEGRVLSIGTAIEYQYSGLGQRVLKITDKGGPGEEKRMYIFNAVTGSVYQERVFDGTSWIHDRYRFHLNGVQLASQKNGEWWKYTFQDQLGTTRVRTNWSGTTVISRHDFYPYGGEHTTASTEEFNVFTQQERDGESGLDHFWARKYQSISGRWTSPDPLFGNIGNPQSLNRYGYVLGNPTNLIDPLGLHECWWWQTDDWIQDKYHTCRNPGNIPPWTDINHVRGDDDTDTDTDLGPNNDDVVPKCGWFESFEHRAKSLEFVGLFGAEYFVSIPYAGRLGLTLGVEGNVSTGEGGAVGQIGLGDILSLGAAQSGPNGELEYYAKALRVSHNLSTGEISLPTKIPIFGLGFSVPEFPFGGEILYNPETYTELQFSCADQ